MSDEEADIYSGIMGLVEGGTEMIGIQSLSKAGKAVKTLAKGTGKQVAKEVGSKALIKQALKEYGIGIADNAIQESIIEPIQEFTAGTVAGKDKANWENIGSRMIDSAINGALVSAIMGGANLGIQSCTGVVQKYKNNENITQEEFTNAVKDASKKLDVEAIITQNVQNETSKMAQNDNIGLKLTKTENKQQTPQEQQVTFQKSENALKTNLESNIQQQNAEKLNNIVDNDKYISKEDKKTIKEATNTLLKNNQLDEANTLDAINQIKQISQTSKAENDTLDIGKKYLTGRKEIYSKYSKVQNYDNTAVNNAKEIVPANKQGKRTKEQWLQVAKQIGTEIANKPNSEVQKIAYKSWQEETPNTTTTLNRQGNKYVKFTSDEWIDTIYDQVQAQRKQTGYTEQNQTITDLDNLVNEINNQKQQIVETNKLKIEDNINLPMKEGMKQRKVYKSIIQSENTSPEAKKISQELIGSDSYIPDSNENQLQRADNRIEKNGIDNEASSLATKVRNSDKITADDIAVGERLIEYYSKIGDKERLQDTIQNVALAGTQLGQAVQSLSLISRQTPQGQAVYIQKVVDRMNNEIDKRTKGKGKKFELTPEMIEKIATSNKENLEQNTTEVAMELANQVPKTMMEKIDSWRYFSMLANPRTHIRNIIGNFSMGGVQTIKNKVAGGLEAIAQKTGMIDKRTKTLKPANKKVRKFAKSDTENVMARLNNESKFDAKNIIQQYQRTFKSNLLEKTLGKAFDLNSKALEKEDVFGLKRAYTKAMSDYMTANKLTPEELTSGTKEADTKLEKARQYAIQQAQEATFHQQSAMASMLSRFENKSTATKLLSGAILPFKKTPINVAKTGIEYSPVGLVKSFTIDVAKVRKGEISPTQYIDNLAKGLTGTGIATVGYALAQAGILSASSDDDDSKKEWYSQDRGNQPFAITIGGKTFTLDWLSPTAIPLFIGAEINKNVKDASKDEATTEDILDRLANGIDGMTKAINPMIEMSMLSGLADTIKGFAQGDTEVFSNLLINSAKSYVNQFFPTIGGQIARTIDPIERSTTSTKKNAFSKAVDSTSKQVLSKIPFASKLLPEKTDVWGNVSQRDSNPLYRALQQTAFPWNEKTLKSTEVDNAISSLYEKTGEKSVLPNTSINKDFTINEEKYRLTSEEYAKYKKEYGKTSYELLNSLVTSKEYKTMTDEQKTKAISEIYSYANENNKINYANEKNIKDVKTSTLYNTVKSIEKSKGNGADYFKYLGKTTGLEETKDKLNELEKLNISSSSKKAIYENTIGKSDKLYTKVLSKSNININEYLGYKQQEFTSDKKDDGTVQGKTITNSKKTKVYDYVNNMDITRTQKILLLGSSYKLNRSEQMELYEYINNIQGQTKQEKLEIFEKYSSNFTVYKNGTISLK